MLREKEFLVSQNNKVWYVGDVREDVVEIVRVKWDSKLQDYKFKDKLKQVSVNDDEEFKFRSYNPDEAWLVAKLLKEMEIETHECTDCGVCCEDIE